REALQFGLTGISRSMPALPPMFEQLGSTFHPTPTPPGLEGSQAGGTSGALRQSSSSLPIPPALATGHTTVILQRRRVAGAAVLFGALVAGVALLAYGAMRDTILSAPAAPQVSSHVQVKPAAIPTAPTDQAAAPVPR